jgi:TIR domain
LNVRLSDDEIAPGENWVSTMAKAVEAAQNFVLLISKSTGKSNFISSEIAAAIANKSLDSKKRIFPVLIDRDADIPSFINQYVALDASGNAFDKAVQQLIDIIVKSDEKITLYELDDVKNGADLLRTQLELEKSIYAIRSRERELYFRASGRVAVLLTTIVSVLALGITIYGSRESYEIVSTIMSFSVALMGAVVGFYFGRKSGGKSNAETEVRK